jgi:hypothetical protein
MKSILIFITIALLGAQTNEKIALKNPSFEDKPRASASPEGWSSKTPDSTPDILPGAWGIDFAAQEGRTCVGLVTRDDGTREDLGQALSEPLKAGTCYKFTIHLAHSPKYVGYNHPIRLRVWGGASGSKDLQLAASPLIDQAEWKKYEFQFSPTKEVRFIILEAYFAPGTSFFYKGNILLDNCSAIERCDRA